MRLLIASLLVLCIYAEQEQYDVTKAKEEVLMVLKIDPGKIDCFFQPIRDPKFVTMEMGYQVTEGGELDLNVMVKNPAGLIILHDFKKTDGNYKIKLVGNNEHGDYAFCFDNSFSSTTSKTVS